MFGRAVGFTGTQKGMTTAQEKSVRAIFETLRLLSFQWLHEGDCIGADADANRIWRQCGGKIHSHPPIKEKLRAFSLFDYDEEPRDYLVRNKCIVNACELLVATPKGPEEIRSGTWSTIRYARSKQLPRLIVFPCGTATRDPL